jgi:hypothetical protein
MTDPKRVAVYFTKHGLLGGKEYQNVPPPEWGESGESVGRFWGVWGLQAVEVAAQVSAEEARVAVRTLRRWHEAGRRAPIRADGTALPVDGEHLRVPVRVGSVWRQRRLDPVTGEAVYRKRKVRRRIRRLTGRAGFLSVNDGPLVAMMVERLVRASAPDRAVPVARGCEVRFGEWGPPGGACAGPSPLAAPGTSQCGTTGSACGTAGCAGRPADPGASVPEHRE